MKRRLHSMILVVLVLAVGGAGTGAAQAEPSIEADSYPATIDSTPLLNSVFTMAGGYKWECKATTLQGQLSAKSNSLTLTPSYGECRWNYPPVNPPFWSVVTVSMNGCDYRLHSLKRVLTGEYSMSADLQCPAGKQVVVDLNSSSWTICRVTLPPQSNIPAGKLVDKVGEGGLEDVELQLAMGPMKYTQDLVGSPIACPVKPGTYETFGIENRVTLTATSEAGKQIGLRVSGE